MATVTGTGTLVGTTGDDTITGGTGSDVLLGDTGSDTLTGGDGNDVLAPDGLRYYYHHYDYSYYASYYWFSYDDEAVDHVDGGGGYDRVALRFEKIASDINADFSDPSASQTIAGSTIVNVEEFQIVLGSGNDTLRLGLGNDVALGGAGNDTLDGGAGNDHLNGGAGNDTLTLGLGNDSAYGDFGDDTIDAGAGNDNLDGGAGNDRLTGGAGTDGLTGGEGSDTVVFAGNAADYRFEVHYGALTVTNVTDGSVDYLHSIETFEFADGTVVAADHVTIVINGTNADEHLHGSYLADTIDGGAGNDTIYGHDGDDRLTGGAGIDRLHGGEGIDTVVFTGNAADYRFEAYQGYLKVTNLTDGSVDYLHSVETFEFADATVAAADHVAIVISGTDLHEGLYGSYLGDTISGAGGNDHIIGYEGDDTLDGGPGHDYLDGGPGNDMLNGGPGNDNLQGGWTWYSGTGGNDVLNGGSGNDWLDGGDGDDELNGGSGIDYTRLNFHNATSGVNYTLADGPVQTSNGSKTLSSIEGVHVDGSQHNDVLTGGSVHDALYGADGDDTLNGEGGWDHLVGGVGNDTLNGGADNDFLHGGAGDDTLNGGDGDDTLVEDWWWYDGGTGGNDVLNGGAGNDYLDGGYGNDELNGGDGLDRTSLHFWTASAGVTYTLGDGTVETSYGTKTLGSIEAANIYGSSHNDVLTGGAAADYIYGNSGDDVLNGAGGDDVLDGGYGTDTLNGGDGADRARLEFYGATSGVTYTLTDGTVDTSQGTKTLNSIEAADIIGSQHNDVITGGAARDWIYGYAGDDTLNGGDGDDSLIGAEGNDTLNGGDGNDFLYDNWNSNSGNDVLNGGAGDDYLNAGEGTDTLNGGDGEDRTYLGFWNAAGVTYTLADGTVQTSHGAKTLSSIEGADIHGSQHNDVITGGSARDNIYGSGGDDVLNGGGGDDYVYGGQGTDTLNGGDGEDRTFLAFWNASTGVTYTLADGTVQTSEGTKTLSSIEAADIHGSRYNDVITGGSARDNIYGDEGADTLNGGAGDDYLHGGWDGSADMLNGAAGDDTLEGYYSSATAVYSGARSQYTITENDDGSVTVVDTTGAEGTDTLWYIENLQFSDGTITMEDALSPPPPVNNAPVVGNAIADQSIDEDATWIFEVPADTFSDEEGDALTYSAEVVDEDGNTIATPSWLSFNASTRTFSGTPPANYVGYLLIKMTASDGLESVSDTFTLTIDPVQDAAVIGNPTNSSVTEDVNVSPDGKLVTTGTISIVDPDSGEQGFSTTVSNATGNLGTLVIDAHGSYTYSVSNSATESLGDGMTKVDTFTVTAVDGTTKQVSFTINGANEVRNGTSGNDNINGTAAHETLYGLGGKDMLKGGGGNDKLFGGDGSDKLIGGTGADIFNGGGANDKFIFESLAEMGTGSARDVIQDFTTGDRIELQQLDANTALTDDQAFAFVAGQSTAVVANSITWYQDTANNRTIIQGDNNGDGIADFQIELTGLKMLSASDFSF